MKSPTQIGQRRASAGSQARVGPGCEDKECGLHETAGEVIGGRRAGLRLEKVVVDDMERSDAEREPRKARPVRRKAPTRERAARSPARSARTGAAAVFTGRSLLRGATAEAAAPRYGLSAGRRRGGRCLVDLVRAVVQVRKPLEPPGRYQFQSPSSFIVAGGARRGRWSRR